MSRISPQINNADAKGTVLSMIGRMSPHQKSAIKGYFPMVQNVARKLGVSKADISQCFNELMVTVMDISCFSDCNSDTIVLRVPHELALRMYKGLEDCEQKQELYKKMLIASSRNKKFHILLKKLSNKLE